MARYPINIEIYDLFFIIENFDIANYADNYSPYFPIHKREKSWWIVEWLRECVVKPVSMAYWKRIERKCKQMSFTDKFWWKCAC